QEGLLFTPLAYTKTFAMAAGAILSITLVPVLMVFFVKGKIIAENKNPLNRFFVWLYHPLIVYGLKLKYLVIVAVVASLGYIYPLFNSLKWEFMPMLNEQTFMYMPVTPYGISVDQAKALTQKTDKIIKSFPEVEMVFGKAGRAGTATDPAPLGMIETIITLKPKSEWPEGVTYDSLRQDMEDALQIPGLTNSWTYPIRGRIDMLLSGIRTPIGIKLYGQNAAGLQKYGKIIEEKLRSFDKTLSVFADQASTGYFLYLDLDEEAMQRYGMRKNQLLEYTSLAIGGLKVSTMYKGLERYPIALRLEGDERRSVESIKNILIKTKLGFVPLSTFAKIYYKQSASVIKSEMATPVTFIYITPQEGVTAKEYVKNAQQLIDEINFEAGYYIEWAGQSQYLDSAMKKIIWIIPGVLLSILVLIYLALKKIAPTLIVFFTLPFALLGGLIYIDMLGFAMSIAVIVGFLALLGIAAETAILMIVYLQESVDEAKKKYSGAFGAKELRAAIYDGSVQRVRPKLMTVFSILAGLAPIMYSHGIGSEVMQRIAAPMLGGIISSAILSLIIIPILFEIMAKRELDQVSN
ncbi:MAG: efflux RND transporter permease subunit, partial [Sulfurimonas sp.]|nr:efflux RND transporter permease subunit [Sulfurimonas sp.]